MLIDYSWYTHNILYRSLELKFTLKAEEPLRIGAGKAAPLATLDLPVVSIKIKGENVPYIPGSSLKGVLRSTSELIVRTSGLKVCMAGSCGQDQIVEGGSRLSKAIEEALKTNNTSEAIDLVSRYYCFTCKIFGSGSYASHVQVSDSYPEGDVIRGAKMGIAINRRSGAVQTGPYTVEFVEPDAQFTTTLRANNLPNYAFGLILVALDYVNEGLIKIGGFKSRGFGRVSVKYQSLTGVVFQQGIPTKLEEAGTLTALDKFDKEVRIQPQNLIGTLTEFKKRWWEYVQSTKSRESSSS
ncbi:MAG: CRISPR-associated RAMP protein Csx7 [Nitrososphaeria archaeon]